MPFVIIAVLAVVLAAAALVFDSGDEDTAAASLRPAALGQIIDRVERERGLAFTRDPRPLVVTPRQAQTEALAAFDTDYPPARRRADEQVLTRLGLLPPRTDLRAAAESTYGESVAGYYDPRSGRLRIVKGAQTANRVLYEMTVAHELTHALEDQRLGLDADAVAGSDDAALAYTALVEGSASALMYRYVADRFGAEETFGGLAASAFAPTGDLPPYLMAQLVFPYTAGEAFVQRLLELGGGGWDVVDTALRDRPPASTEQVMHPEKWVRVEAPKPVRTGAPAVLGREWRRAVDGVFGEFQTRELLAGAGGGGSAQAAAGWGGDRYELWRRGSGDCAAPCRPGAALVVRWRWDTPADEREFAAKLRQWVRDGLGAVPQAGGTFGIDAGHVAVGRRGGAVTLAMAPDAPLAKHLAGS